MELVTETLNLKTHLEQSYGKPLLDAEYKEYKDRLVKFFSLLMEIDRQQKKKKAHERDNK